MSIDKQVNEDETNDNLIARFTKKSKKSNINR